MSEPGFPWERPLGSRPLGDGTVAFRVWAPRAESIALRVGRREHALDDAGYGIHEAVVEAQPGDDYSYVVDGRRLPDPCSRSQPKGLRGPSRVLDITPAERSAAPGSAELVIYELHVGTFTAEGTFEAAASHLAELAEIGVTAIELMPVAEFPGQHGWGYDGVYISAPHSGYGGPTGLAKLVAAAHEHRLEVILDVVYNHVGASGVKALERFGPYFTTKYETPWGQAINFDGADSDPVREWVLQSAESWIRDYNIDGLRLDAIHSMYDSSAEHIVAEIVRRVHSVRDDAWVIAESGLNDPRVMRMPELGGYGCNAAWADDFHHALRTVLTGERAGYYAEFGRVSQLAKAFHRPHVDDGNYSKFRRRRFGARADDVPPRRFVVFSQNHDQVGNRAFGDRLPASVRPLAAFCTLLSPFVPMLFMGEEYGETAPFQFFSDHVDKRIADATREGRRREFAAFAEFEDDIPDPQDPATFERSKLTRKRDPRLADLYAQLIVERRRLPPGDADAIEFDEEQRWLRVQRGPFEILCNFSDEPRGVPCDGTSVELSTHDPPQPSDGLAELPPMSGALIR
ncbi:MAG TPA: malto-oligosyltrehalose trehalohydrolase [Solirubrobacteraceae bacterium]|nr:malto-oligosyltrehalose trehalohydrolase [Solirubrobacteraceae bacterium]